MTADLLSSCESYNFWKTFGPPLITGSVTMMMAGFALKVSLAQRTIAKNKYILDLFESRLPVYDNFILIIEDIEQLFVSYDDHAAAYKNITKKYEKEIEKCKIYFYKFEEYFNTLSNSIYRFSYLENRLEENKEKNKDCKEYIEDIQYINTKIKSCTNHINNLNKTHSDIDEDYIFSQKMLDKYKGELKKFYSIDEYNSIISKLDTENKLLESAISTSKSGIQKQIKNIKKVVFEQLKVSYTAY